MFAVKKRFFDERCGLNFFPRKCPVAVELNLKHRKLTKVVEQTHNMSTWSDRSKIAIYVMSSRDTKIKRTLLLSGLGLLAKEYEKNPSYGHTRICPKRRVGDT